LVVQVKSVMSRLPVKDRENILIVDDESMITDTLRIHLSKLGVIDCARNGKEAFEKLAVKYYAAILTDTHMPVMDGIDFYSKAVEAYPSIKKRILFYTGNPDACRSFFEENGLIYLSKPTRIKDIKNVIANILHGRRKGP
jgi:YesN/AraC family two-component response regulator